MSLISPWNKKSLEIKSYHFQTFFLGLFFWLQYDFKKSTWKKSPFLVENAWEQRMFTTMEKQGLDIKNAPGYIHLQVLRRKVLFMTGPHAPKTKAFFQDFNSCNVISWDFIGSSHIILGGKNHRNLKLRKFFPVTFFPRNSENWDFFTKVFISRFFPWNFFSSHFFA